MQQPQSRKIPIFRPWLLQVLILHRKASAFRLIGTVRTVKEEERRSDEPEAPPPHPTTLCPRAAAEDSKLVGTPPPTSSLLSAADLPPQGRTTVRPGRPVRTKEKTLDAEVRTGRFAGQPLNEPSEAHHSKEALTQFVQSHRGTDRMRTGKTVNQRGRVG